MSSLVNKVESESVDACRCKRRNKVPISEFENFPMGVSLCIWDDASVNDQSIDPNLQVNMVEFNMLLDFAFLIGEKILLPATNPWNFWMVMLRV